MSTKTKQFNRQTPANDIGGGDVRYLDRHDIKCNSNEILVAANLIQPTYNTMAYIYRCVSDERIGKKTYKGISSYWPFESGKHTIDAQALNHLIVRCSRGYVLQQFKLLSNPNGMQYEFTCVKYKYKKSKYFFTNLQTYIDTKTINILLKQVIKFDDHPIIGFKLMCTAHDARGVLKDVNYRVLYVKDYNI